MQQLHLATATTPNYSKTKATKGTTPNYSNYTKLYSNYTATTGTTPNYNNANGRKRFLGIHYAKKITVLKTKSSAVTTTANGFQWKTKSWPLLSLNQSNKFIFHYNITVYIIHKLRQLKNESVLQVLKKQLK